MRKTDFERQDLVRFGGGGRGSEIGSEDFTPIQAYNLLGLLQGPTLPQTP